MLKFYDESHSYINTDGSSYRSVTGILHKLQKPKDWDAIAAKYAKKHKLSLEEVKLKWKYEKDISIVRGKKIHSLFEENSLKDSHSTVEYEDLCYDLPVIKPIFDGQAKVTQSMKLLPGIYPEIIIWLDSLQIAGQADRVEIVNKKINVYDYKTNKKIETEAYTNYMGEREHLLPPCSHLDCCNFNIYSLQLNMYAYMLKRHNPTLSIGKMQIIHLLFEDDSDTHKITNTVIYDVPNLQKEIVSILKYVENKKI